MNKEVYNHYNLIIMTKFIKILGGPDRLAASEARARSRGASPSRRHQHHIHVHGPINASVNVGQPSKCLLQSLIKIKTTIKVLLNIYKMH